jgi:glycine/D-amino acid oxidase-like deaminating enzyme
VPAYVDYERAFYGTGDLDELGVKAAVDHDGPPVDPDAPLPPAGADGEADARALVAERFPALADAPLAGSKTCRYELTPDGHFLAARHPQHPSVWLLGGGSGHGFKHGPAMAERLALTLQGGAPLPARFSLGPRAPGRSVRTAGGSR